MAAILMKPVYAVGAQVISALGLDTEAHWDAVKQGKIGIQRFEDPALSPTTFWGSKFSDEQWRDISAVARVAPELSPFEQMCVFAAKAAMQQAGFLPDAKDTLLVLSTTKGNIEWLGRAADERLLLSTSANLIAGALGISVQPAVVAHACISGVVATQYALRNLQAGRYRHAIVVGADRFTRFVLSGFQSFQAVADGPCRPFDAARNGINLGEAAGAIIFSTDERYAPLAQLLSGSTSNDANHISGPSRTGAELALAIGRALDAAGIDATQVDMISAHGTATVYNDEMESKAFALSRVNHAATHSFKGYIGHTLGAAGVVESALIIKSLQEQSIIGSAGFSELGVSEPLPVSRQTRAGNLRYVLKTASGFGGCNATAIWAKV